MPIITYLKDFIAPMEALINVYPDRYVSEKEKVIVTGKQIGRAHV